MRWDTGRENSWVIVNRDLSGDDFIEQWRVMRKEEGFSERSVGALLSRRALIRSVYDSSYWTDEFDALLLKLSNRGIKVVQSQCRDAGLPVRGDTLLKLRQELLCKKRDEQTGLQQNERAKQLKLARSLLDAALAGEVLPELQWLISHDPLTGE